MSAASSLGRMVKYNRIEQYKRRAQMATTIVPRTMHPYLDVLFLTMGCCLVDDLRTIDDLLLCRDSDREGR